MKKKSRIEKEVEGTYRDDRDKTPASTDEDIKIPKPSLLLSLDAKSMYYGIIEIARKDKAFKIQDAHLIEDYCYWRGLWVQATRQIKSFDDCYEVYDKGSNVNGKFTAMTRIYDYMRRNFPDLGIGNKSRQNIEQYINNYNQLNLFDPNNNPFMVPKPEPKLVSIK